mmetsp:Transcript_103740/g.298480  ORF Transcript_103740/g.298480 Transcript_103740/m.298480 type:complete len:256 (-) Transcript_103740:2721-3488(-)
MSSTALSVGRQVSRMCTTTAVVQPSPSAVRASASTMSTSSAMCASEIASSKSPVRSTKSWYASHLRYRTRASATTSSAACTCPPSPPLPPDGSFCSTHACTRAVVSTMAWKASFANIHFFRSCSTRARQRGSANTASSSAATVDAMPNRGRYRHVQEPVRAPYMPFQTRAASRGWRALGSRWWSWWQRKRMGYRTRRPRRSSSTPTVAAKLTRGAMRTRTATARAVVAVVVVNPNMTIVNPTLTMAVPKIIPRLW